MPASAENLKELAESLYKDEQYMKGHRERWGSDAHFISPLQGLVGPVGTEHHPAGLQALEVLREASKPPQP